MHTNNTIAGWLGCRLTVSPTHIDTGLKTSLGQKIYCLNSILSKSRESITINVSALKIRESN